MMIVDLICVESQKKDDDDNECGNDELPVGFCGEEKGGSTKEEYDETRNYEEHGSDA